MSQVVAVVLVNDVRSMNMMNLSKQSIEYVSSFKQSVRYLKDYADYHIKQVYFSISLCLSLFLLLLLWFFLSSFSYSLVVLFSYSCFYQSSCSCMYPILYSFFLIFHRYIITLKRRERNITIIIIIITMISWNPEFYIRIQQTLILLIFTILFLNDTSIKKKLEWWKFN